MTKRIVLCADDYGQDLAISRGILALVEGGRLSAVSCLVTQPGWQEQGEWLHPWRGKIDVGLHFNLTEGEALSSAYVKAHGSRFLPLNTLIKKSFTRQVARQAIEAELTAQLARFSEVIGQPPDFIDGHQHVHQFPVIRDAVLTVYQKQFRDTKPYIRLVNHRLRIGDIKKLIIYLTGTAAFRRLLDQANIPRNSSFAGVYQFAHAADYEAYFRRFLKEIRAGGIIMCHPGWRSENPLDAIAQARCHEYEYFLSTAFLKDCNAAGVSLSRMMDQKQVT